MGSGNPTTNELLNLVRDVKGKKSSYRCISSKKRTRKNVSSLLNRARDLVTQDMEKAMVWDAFDCQ